MTLRDLLTAYPARFYPQDWYWDETFLDHDVVGRDLTTVKRGVGAEEAGRTHRLPFAAQVVAAMLKDDRLDDAYVWCADTDAQGQRVYVGHNGRGIEIHRHLHITSRWSIAA